MKRKEIVLNGVKFEVHKSTHICIDSLSRYAGRTLNDCYTKPSYSKQYIYNMWEEWAYLNNVEYFGISSYTCQHFSLQGLVEHEGIVYILNITALHNRAYYVG